MKIRPSALPKLAQCRCFTSSTGAPSAEASRGTTLDGIIRQAWQDWVAKQLNENNPAKNIVSEFGMAVPREMADCLPPGMTPKDREACVWAMKQLELYSHGSDVLTAEDDCRAASIVEDIANGTMDAVIPAERTLLDFKTGIIRGYKEQMAAYALACMETYFSDEWKAVLLFIDQQEVVTHEFTREQAEACVQSVVEKPLLPASCDYCSWCAHYESCPCTRLALATVEGGASGVTMTAKLKSELRRTPAALDIVKQLVDNPEKAAEFHSMLGTAKSIDEIVMSHIKDAMKRDGVKKRGRFTLSTIPGKTSYFVPPDVVGHYIREIGFDAVLLRYGAMPAEAFEELLEKLKIAPPRDRYVSETKSTTYRLSVGKA